jgi:hypothetical protein
MHFTNGAMPVTLRAAVPRSARIAAASPVATITIATTA